MSLAGVGRGPNGVSWQGRWFRGAVVLTLVSLGLLAWLVAWHLIDKHAVEDDARDQASAEAVTAANGINGALEQIREAANDLAKDLSSGALADEDVEGRLKADLIEYTDAGAVVAAFAPDFVPESKVADGVRLYAPFSQREENGAVSIVLTEETYDYTGPEGVLGTDAKPHRTSWYSLPIAAEEGEAVWGEPYFGSLTGRYWAGVGVPFYQTDPESNQRVPAGVVDVSLTLEKFQKLVSEVTLNNRPAAGYAFILSGSGLFISHPIDDFVTDSNTISEFDQNLTIAELERASAETSGEGETLSIEHVDKESGQESWVFYARIPSVGWWVGVVLEKEHFRSSGVLHRLRRQQIGIALAAAAALFFFSVLVLRAYNGSTLSLWGSAAVFAIACVALIGFLWYLNINNLIAADDRNILLVDKAVTEKVIHDLTGENSDSTVHVPTGMFVQSVEFSSSNNVTLTGYLWQRYPAEIPEEFAGITPLSQQSGLPLTPGFIFPEAESTSAGEVYRQTQENGDVLIGYNFNTVLRQQFDYTEYPFDREDVWVRIWHKDFDKNVILTPDLYAYTTTDPRLLPGLEQQDFVLEDWEITETFFSYRGNRYNTDFGLTDPSRRKSIPELYFNIGLERRFANIFISNLIPIIVVAFLLFAVLLTVNAGREGSSLFGFSTSSVLSFAAALFFVVIIAHVNLARTFRAKGLFTWSCSISSSTWPSCWWRLTQS